MELTRILQATIVYFHFNRDFVCRYFATDGFSYGSTTSHWQQMRASMAAVGKVFIPSVGPVRLPNIGRCSTSRCNAGCRATMIQKFALGIASGDATGMEDHTTI